MLSKVQAVKPEQIQEVMQKYMVPIFQPESSNLVVTCAQIMRDNLHEGFLQAGYKPDIRTLESFQDDYGMNGPEVEEADDDENDDDCDNDDDERINTPESDEDS